MLKNKIKFLVFFMILILCLSFSGIIFAQDETSYELTPQDKVILTEPSVCFITTYFWGYVLDPWTNNWSAAYYWAFVGTGFCVNPDTGHIVTAGHMVEINLADFRYNLIEMFLLDNYDLSTWTDADWNWAYENIKVEGYDGGDYDMEVYVQFNTANSGIPDNPTDFDTYIRAEVIDYSGLEQRDLALLRIQPQTGRALSGVMIGDSSSVEIQDSLTIIGYPWTSDIGQSNTMNPTITNGSISGKIMLNGTEVLQIQGDAREGNSGGPVLNSDGEVVGILTMGTDFTNNYLRPSNDVKEMLSRNGVINKQGIVDDAFMQGLEMYRLKHFSKAIENFNAVLNLNQRHLLAQEYRSKSQEAINKGEEIPYSEDTDTGTADVEVVEPETTVPVEESIVTVEETEEQPAAGETAETGSVALGLTIIILAIVLPIIFIIIVVVVIILIVKRKGNAAKKDDAVGAGKAEESKKSEKEDQTKYCTSCGSVIEEGQKFCGNCGNKVE